MFFTQRILKSISGTLTDVSIDLNYHHKGSIIAALNVGDYLYVGSDLPFNHKYFEIEAGNVNAASLAVEIWYSGAWVSAVDLIDETAASGKTLAAGGIVQWATNRLKGWEREQDSADVTGLTDTVIYNMYWARFSVSAELSAATEVSFVGNRFSNDVVLFEQYPGLNNTELMAAFKAGKTDWNEQHQVAADFIVRELKSRSIITSGAQLLDSSLFTEAAVHKTAHVIYSALGKAYAEHRDEAIKAYHRSLNFKHFHADTNADASTSPVERAHSTGFMTR